MHMAKMGAMAAGHLALVVAVLLAPHAVVVAAAPDKSAKPDPCTFSWNVDHERALFASTARTLDAGSTLAMAPALDVDRLIELTLRPQTDVGFVAAPQGKKSPDKSAYAGIARLHVSHPGHYRIAVSEAFWVDVLRSGQAIQSQDFAGNHACHAPRKIVLYDLPSGDLVLQLSGVAAEHVRLVITPAS
jgi:hypothetical protein